MGTICRMVSGVLMYCHVPGGYEYPVQVQPSVQEQPLQSQSVYIATGCAKNRAYRTLRGGEVFYSESIERQCWLMGY